MATNPRRAASVCADGTAWRPRPEFGSRPALPRPPSPRAGRICDPRARSRYSQWPYRQRPQHRGLPQLASDSLPQRHAPPGQYADEITSHFFGDANYTRMIGWPDMIQPLTEDGWTGRFARTGGWWICSTPTGSSGWTCLRGCVRSTGPRYRDQCPSRCLRA